MPVDSLPRYSIEGLQQHAGLPWNLKRQLMGVQQILSQQPLRQCSTDDLCYITIILQDIAMLPEILQTGAAFLNQSGILTNASSDVQLGLSRHYFLQAHPQAYAQILQQSQAMQPDAGQQHFIQWIESVELDCPGHVQTWLDCGEINIQMLMTMLSLISLQTEDRARQYFADHHDQAVIAVGRRIMRWQPC